MCVNTKYSGEELHSNGKLYTVLCSHIFGYIKKNFTSFEDFFFYQFALFTICDILSRVCIRIHVMKGCKLLVLFCIIDRDKNL